MIPIGNMIATLDGFKPMKEVLDVYHKAIELEKENARLREALEDLIESILGLAVKANEDWLALNFAKQLLKESEE